jgi:hypothetical protein
MNDFKDFGRWIEEEVKRVKHVVETEVSPTAQKKVIEGLRMASEKLAQIAEKLEKRANRASA